MVAITLTKTCLRHDGHRYGIGETVDVPDNLAASLIAEGLAGLAIAAPTPTGEDGGGSTVSPSPPPPTKKPAKPAEAG
ncbi:hypothetical protein [Tistrella mobilis]|uniref:DUF7210 domain-containing protein n=1 Tax=Tistrella mobilis (strain KA081020-065) TaxID=1110502 RepID=I3TN76_TISMK|nr:hypothetical protein [Tistrella mobilis]AFK54214.1 hypothetical protein TMO_2376 [Tistrella mobilis KA081020-065]